MFNLRSSKLFVEIISQQRPGKLASVEPEWANLNKSIKRAGCQRHTGAIFSRFFSFFSLSLSFFLFLLRFPRSAGGLCISGATSFTFSNWPRSAILHPHAPTVRDGRGSPVRQGGRDFWNFKSGFALQMRSVRLLGAMSRSAEYNVFLSIKP